MAKLNLFKIFRGTTANDETGTPARSAAEGINNNMDAIANELVRIDEAAEKASNKATNMDSPNDENFPTTQAVEDRVGGVEADANLYTDGKLASYQHTEEKGAAEGYAPLDANSKVPAANTYAAMDEIIEGEYINATTFNDTTGNPVTPGAAKLYQDTTTGNPNSGMQYRWSGTQFSPIPSSPGTTDEVVEGSTNLYHTAARVRATLLTGLSTTISATLAAGDTVITAFGKLQAQINSFTTALGTKLDKGTYTGTASTLVTLIETKETPLGAQTKADTALQAAKDYYDGLTGGDTEIIERYTDFASFPAEGFEDTLYVDEAELKAYLWDDFEGLYFVLGETFTPIAENEFGAHPAFTSQHDLNAYLLGNSDGGGGTDPDPTDPTDPDLTTTPQLLINNISETGFDYSIT